MLPNTGLNVDFQGKRLTRMLLFLRMNGVVLCGSASGTLAWPAGTGPRPCPNGGVRSLKHLAKPFLGRRDTEEVSDGNTESSSKGGLSALPHFLV